MAEHDLWERVELGKRNGSEFRARIDAMTQLELSQFLWDHVEAEDDLHSAGLRAQMGEGTTDETVDHMAEWIVDQGIDYYYDVLEDISKAPPELPGDAAKGLRRVAQRSYRVRFRNAVELSGSPLWELIDLARRDQAAFERKLLDMPEPELVGASGLS